MLLVWAVDSEASLDREVSLELIRYLVPDVFQGALLDSLSGHALSAAALAASFTPEGKEGAQPAAPAASICSVIKAQQPGWLTLLQWLKLSPCLMFNHPAEPAVGLQGPPSVCCFSHGTPRTLGHEGEGPVTQDILSK